MYEDFRLEGGLSEGLEAYQDTPSYKLTIPQVCLLRNVLYMSYSLNSLKGVIWGFYRGGVIKGDTGSLDYP